MKKALIVFILFLYQINFAKTGADTTVAIKKENRKNLFSFYPFAIGGSAIVVSYERKILSENALRIVIGFGSSEDQKLYDFKNYSELYSELQYRFYPISSLKSKYYNGIYMAPYILAKIRGYEKTITESEPIFTEITTKYNQNAFSGGLLIGYNHTFLERISLDFYLGGGMMLTNSKTPDFLRHIPINQYIRGVSFHIGFNVGFNF